MAIPKIDGYSDPQQIYYDEEGWGACWMAVHMETRQRHVIKLFSWKIIDEVKHELEIVETMRKINNPYFVKILDSKKDPTIGEYYIMEHWGDSLRNRITSIPPHPLWSINIIKQILNVLEVFHEHHLVHRDINPNNIFIQDAEKGVEAKLGDYGLVRRQRWATPLTTGGTFLYMAPEMMPGADGSKRDHRVDIYSVGAVLHQLLTMLPVIGMVSEKPPGILPIPGDLWQIVRKALAKEPEDRFQTAEEFLNAITKVSVFFVAMSFEKDKRKGRQQKATDKNDAISEHDSFDLIDEEREAKLEEETKSDTQAIWTDEINKLYKAKEYVEIISRLERKLFEAEKTYGRNSTQLIPILSTLGYVASIGKKPFYDQYYENTLEILYNIEGHDSPKLIPILNAQAWAHYRVKDFEQAEETYKRALNIVKLKYPENSIQSAKQMSLLGDFYYYKKDYPQAESYYQQALTIKKKVLGEDNVGLCDTIRALAYLYRVTGRYPLSEALYKSAVDILNKNNAGYLHPEYKRIYEGMRYLYKKMGYNLNQKEIKAKLLQYLPEIKS